MTVLPRSSILHKRECYIDQYGNENCDMSYGVRLGVGLAIAAAFAVLFLVLSFLAKRRRQRMNVAPTFATNMPVQPYQTENTQWNNTYGGQSSGTPQAYYPPAPQHKNNSYYGSPAGPPPPLEDPYHPDHLPMPPPSYQRKESDNKF